MVAALMTEIKMQSAYLKGREVETIYFGGGTPSAIAPEEIDQLLEVVNKHFKVAPGAEITLEANPDDINADTLRSWKQSGINRLSIGVQAFQEEILKAWNRSHSAEQGKAAIQLAQDTGIENITADLIYGDAGLSDEAWQENILQLTGLGIPHISSYALTVEQNTALFHHIKTGKTKSPDDDQAARQYVILQSMLQAAGFDQYEVSNFAQPGFESKHNQSYWLGKHYLGIGPSAHSYDGVSRQWNVSNNAKYIQAIQSGELVFEKEVLTDEQKYNELVMTGLRTKQGIDIKRLKSLGSRFVKYLEKQAGTYLEQNQMMSLASGNIALVPSAYFLSDGIAAELFYSDK